MTLVAWAGFKRGVLFCLGGRAYNSNNMLPKPINVELPGST